jgi:C1A family cysteine protease
MDYGLGALQSPPDARDFSILDLLAATPPVALPSSFRVKSPAPTLDQGSTPMCVAFSTARMKMWQDRDDQTVAKWFDFDEVRFFRAIGGTAQGAYLRAAMDRALKVGYPVVNGTSPTAAHRIKAYYAVPKTISEIKAAIYRFGTVVLATPWYNSWMKPVNGVLPPPDYTIGGHAITAEGWDDRWGLLLVNSWGTRWSAIHRGAAYMPYRYVTHSVWEVWKSIDT